MSDGEMNLRVPRGARNVWDDAGWAETLSSYDQERWMAIGGGALTALMGARRGGFSGGLMAVAGMALAYRAATGHHDVRIARDWLDRTLVEKGYRHKDVVEDASEESFPASDSPSWTASAGARTDQ